MLCPQTLLAMLYRTDLRIISATFPATASIPYSSCHGVLLLNFLSRLSLNSEQKFYGPAQWRRGLRFCEPIGYSRQHFMVSNDVRSGKLKRTRDGSSLQDNTGAVLGTNEIGRSSPQVKLGGEAQVVEEHQTRRQACSILPGSGDSNPHERPSLRRENSGTILVRPAHRGERRRSRKN